MTSPDALDHKSAATILGVIYFVSNKFSKLNYNKFHSKLVLLANFEKLNKLKMELISH